MRRLSGKVALVTGGARGIGLATARRFAEEGAAAVILADIDAEAGARAAATNPVFRFAPLDVTQDAAWQDATDEAVAREGELDVVVNCAGIAVVATIESVTLEQWRRVQAVNVDGTFLGCRHAVRVMKPPAGRGGAIINLSSVSGIIGGHNLAAYNASKGAVRLLTKSVALHCARQGYGIRCNSIHPGFTETDMLHDLAAGGRDPEALRERLRASVPLGRNARADEIAALAAYLAADESGFVTGAELVIDGGVTAQ
ncbi:glucose 1-dehydrogenase [Methylobacterium sp. WSM2598]|uniref:glucose 1-dehydrogenase n=1 Tax=Methylobacterium sp. WSM2598 TaxID=398261 RepID=UPI000378FF1B|nr:glucose 1-dehydrogenase [Methylobacterium sp. WSM2598]